MRLLNTTTLKLVDFPDESTQPYAILSHTWGQDELSFQDIQALHNSKLASFLDTRPQDKEGFAKVKGAADLARGNGFEWIWIDTCCIDKTSSAELSEAINSMYRWYAESITCYAYLSDVDPVAEGGSISDGSFYFCRWFQRGWTLQELVAPKNVLFYARDWSYLGQKRDEAFVPALSAITDIDVRVLNMTLGCQDVSVSTRMKWAARRSTTRAEDMAYCLLGLFGVNMPLLYGEGRKAFIRLQEAILRETEDQSIFAWTTPSDLPYPADHLSGLLADSPKHFAYVPDIRPLPPRLSGESISPSMSSRGLNVELYLKPHQTDENAPAGSGEFYLAILDCSTKASGSGLIRSPAIVLQRLWGKQFARIETSDVELVNPPEEGAAVDDEGYRTLFVRQNPTFVLPDFIVEPRSEESSGDEQVLDVGEVFPPHRWDATVGTLKSVPSQFGIVMGAFVFSDAKAGRARDVFVAVGLKRRSGGRGWLPWCVQSPARNLNLASWFFALEGHMREHGLAGPYENDNVMSQSRVSEISRHGRTYVSLKVTMKVEVWAGVVVGPAAPANAIAGIRRAVTNTDYSTERRQVVKMLTPCTVGDSVALSVFRPVIPESELAETRADTRARVWDSPPKFKEELSPHAPPLLEQLRQAVPMKFTSSLLSHEMDLFHACNSNNAKKVEKFIYYTVQGGGSAETVTEIVLRKFHGLRPLHIAIIAGHTETTKVLVEAKADIFSRDEGGFTPMHYAALNPSPKLAELLVGGVNMPLPEETAENAVPDALWASATARRKRMLLAQTSDLRELPLHLAMANGSVSLMVLSSQPAEQSRLGRRFGPSCSTETVAQSEYRHLLDILSSFTPSQLASHPRSNFFASRNLLGETLLHRAAATSNWIGIDWLLDHFRSASVAAAAKSTKPAKHSAGGPTVDDEGLVHIATEDNFGRTSLWHAAASGDLVCVSRLLDALGIRVGPAPPASELPPGYEAAPPSAQERLVDLPDLEGRTPLWVAAACGYVSVVEALLEARASPDGAATTTATEEAADGADGDSSQWLSSKRSSSKLLAGGAAGGAGGDERRDAMTVARGVTPLHAAALWGHDACVDALLAAGADPWIGVPAVMGLLPVDSAVRNRNGACVARIRAVMERGGGGGGKALARRTKSWRTTQSGDGAQAAAADDDDDGEDDIDGTWGRKLSLVVMPSTDPDSAWGGDVVLVDDSRRGPGDRKPVLVR